MATHSESLWAATKQLVGYTNRRGFRSIPCSAVAQKKNGFRHTFATYHVALHGNANLTMHILGQEEDSKAFFEHYRGHADKEEAERFFGLFIGAVLPTVEAPKKEDQRSGIVIG